MVKKFKVYKKTKVEKKKKDYTIKNLYNPEYTSSAFIHKNMKESMAKKNIDEGNLSNTAVSGRPTNKVRCQFNLLENISNGAVQNSTKGKMASKIK